MPFLSILTNSPTPPAARARDELFARLSAALSRAFDKDERWVMVALAPRAEMSFAGSSAPCAYAELKNVGTLSPAQTESLSQLVCDELASALGVARDRIYIEFTNAEGALWGWNGETFG